MDRNERGTTTLIMAMVTMVTVIAGMAAWMISGVAAAKAWAQGVADLAALAAALGDGQEIGVVDRNGATLVATTIEGTSVTVTIRARGAQATAVAQPVPGGDGEGP
jgi:hypothetical protein